MRLGIAMAMEPRIAERIHDVRGMVFDNIQLSFWEPKYYTDECLHTIQRALTENGVELT